MKERILNFYNYIILYIKKEKVNFLYILGMILSFISVKISQIVSQNTLLALVSITTICCLIPLIIDIENFKQKLDQYKNNLFFIILVKSSKYLVFSLISFNVITISNEIIVASLQENPNNYPTTLAILIILVTPLLWFTTTMLIGTITSIIIPTFLSFVLIILSFINITFNIQIPVGRFLFKSIIIFITITIVLGYLRGIEKSTMQNFDKFISYIILKTAFYENKHMCKNLEDNNLIAFSTNPDEMILYIKTQNNKLETKRVKCNK